jgi:hypothetical protein
MVNHWQVIEHRREFFDWMAGIYITLSIDMNRLNDSESLSMGNQDDWYGISQADIIKYGGKGLLNYYEGSPSKVC